MTAQEIFTTVREHLIKQGEPAMSTGGHHSCAYRSSGGLKCAVGCLIPDEVYRGYMEDETLSNVLDEEGLEHIREHYELLVDLQQVHDLFKVPRWGEALRDVAGEYGLYYEEKPQ